jgi:hypothetical protein
MKLRAPSTAMNAVGERERMSIRFCGAPMWSEVAQGSQSASVAPKIKAFWEMNERHYGTVAGSLDRQRSSCLRLVRSTHRTGSTYLAKPAA